MSGRLFHIFLLTAVLLLPGPGLAFDVDGLDPVGSGEVRYLGLIKVYDATLFAPQNSTASSIQSAEDNYCLALDYAVDLSSDKFILAANKTLEKQWSPVKLAAVREQIEQLHNSYRDVRKGDRYSLCYNAQKNQLELALNNQLLTAIQSRPFAALYAGIWLSDNSPIDKTLQTSLLKTLKQRTPQ